MQIKAIADVTAAAGTGAANATIDNGVRQSLEHNYSSTDTINNSGLLFDRGLRLSA